MPSRADRPQLLDVLVERLIVEREREIELFKPQEYWSVVARLKHDGTQFPARLVRFEGEALPSLNELAKA